MCLQYFNNYKQTYELHIITTHYKDELNIN